MGEDMGKYQIFEDYFEGLCGSCEKDIDLTLYFEKKAEIVKLILLEFLLIINTPSKETEENLKKRADHFKAHMRNGGLSEPKDGGELMVYYLKEIFQDHYEVPVPRNVDFLGVDTKEEAEIAKRDEIVDNILTHCFTHLATLWQFYQFVRPKKIPLVLLIKLDLATLELVRVTQYGNAIISQNNERMLRLWNSNKKSGQPKSGLREAVEYLYDKLEKDGDTLPLQKGNIDLFLGKLQDSANEKKPSFFEDFIGERIATVKKSYGQWVIIPQELEITKVSRRRSVKSIPVPYTKSHVSTILSRIRKKKPGR